MKKSKSPTQPTHTSRTKKPMGDYYGSGKRQNVGKVRSGTVGSEPVSKKSLRTPPKSLA